MISQSVVRAVAILACATFIPAMPAEAQRTVVCSSRGFRYQYCGADTDNDVRLERQLSSIRCRQGDNWGYDRRGVWVDRGCEAEFRVGRDRGVNKGAVVAGAAVAGVAIAAIIAANRNRQGETAAWSVGRFRAYDTLEATDLEIEILPGGAVQGRAGDTSFTGTLTGRQLDLGNYRFKVDKAGTGLLAVDDANPAHRLQFRRAGGY